MTFNLSKIITIYLLLSFVLLYIKPPSFYYDNDKTKLKPWNLVLHTKNINDCYNFHIIIIIAAIISVFIIG
jgi:hypothetical protein